MNLRVDLILETEKRSASVISAKSLLRMLAILVPVILVVVIGVQIAQLMSLKSECNNKKLELKEKEPKKKEALELSDRLNSNRVMLNELKGWKNSRIDWYKQLVALQKEIPQSMVFETLRLTHAFDKADNVPARLFTLSVRGRTYGDASVDSVQLVKRQLTIQETFSKVMEAPQVTIKQDEAPGADPRDRIFSFDCVYRKEKRKFE